ncbi:MAG: hypothetical protein ACLUNX_05505 [Angelakisella sp.]
MVLSKLREQLRPELLGRLDETILFQPLRKEELRQIAVQLLQGVQSRLREQEIGMEFEDTVVEQIVAGRRRAPMGRAAAAAGTHHGGGSTDGTAAGRGAACRGYPVLRLGAEHPADARADTGGAVSEVSVWSGPTCGFCGL